MPRFIAFAISFFWMSVFAVLAMAAAGVIETGKGGGILVNFAGMATPVFVVGFLLVAAAFLWAFIATIFDDGQAPGDVDWIVRVAVASAVVVSTFALLFLAPFAPEDALAGALLAIAALGASVSAVDAECRIAMRRSVADKVGVVAGRMALGAAHNTMLSAISQRGGRGEN